jgi:hypothetical protein
MDCWQRAGAAAELPLRGTADRPLGLPSKAAAAHGTGSDARAAGPPVTSMRHRISALCSGLGVVNLHLHGPSGRRRAHIVPTAVYSAAAGSLGRAGGPRSSATIGLDTIPSQSRRLVMISTRNTGRRVAIYATCMRCVPRAACEVSQLAPRGDEMPRLRRVAARATGSAARPKVRGVSSMRDRHWGIRTGCGVANVYLHAPARSRRGGYAIWRHWAAALPDRGFWPRDGGRETAARSRGAPARGCARRAWVVARACAGWG